jgi:hypothetical protein
MAWVPKAGALKRWRDFRRMLVEDLAKATRVSVRNIGRLESEDDRPDTCQDATAKDLARGLSDQKLQCKPGHLFFWRRADGTLDDLEPVDPTVPKKKVKQASQDGDEPAARKKRTITTIATIERQLRRHEDTVKLGGKELTLVGAHYLQRIEAEYGDLEGRHFAICGTVEDCRPIPPVAIDALKAQRGRGGRVFKIARMVEGVDSSGELVEFETYATVFAPSSDLSAELFRCHESGLTVAVDVHIYVALARDEWKGFFHYEGPRSRPSPKEWALVADAVYPGHAVPVRRPA